MYGMMMLVVALLGAMIVRQTPMVSSDTTAINAFGHPATIEQAQAQAIADNLVLAHHEMQAECVDQTVQVVRDPGQNPRQPKTGATPYAIAIGRTATTTGTGAAAATWPAAGAVNPTCAGSTAFSATNTGSNATLANDPGRTTDTTDERTKVPMLTATGGPLGRIAMLRSGMYLVTTWVPPAGSSLAYAKQVCGLAAAYLRNRLGGADWVGTYDGAAGAVRIWYGVGSVPAAELAARAVANLAIPIPAQTGLTDGCPAYVEPLHN